MKFLIETRWKKAQIKGRTDEESYWIVESENSYQFLSAASLAR